MWNDILNRLDPKKTPMNAVMAPGGNNTKMWLERVYQKIVDPTWVEAINKCLLDESGPL